MSRQPLALISSFALLAAGISLSDARAQPSSAPVATAQVQGTLLIVEPLLDYLTAVVHVAGPSGYEARREFAEGGALSLDLIRYGGAESDEISEAASSTSLVAGGYRWAVFLTDRRGRLRQASGRFRVGAESLEEEFAPASSANGSEQSGSGHGPIQRNSINHSDDVSISDAEDDGVTFLLLDSDDANGNVFELWKVENFFGDLRIVEFGGGTQQGVPLTIVDDGDGEVGFGTTLPVQRLHMVGGAGDGLRLEDALAPGLGAWDIQVFGDDRFEIEDVETGFDPFVIEEGSRDNSLYIDEFSNIGIGTGSPVDTLHMVSTSPGIRMSESDERGAVATLVVETEDDRVLFKIQSDNLGGTALSIDLDTGALAFGGPFTSTSSGAHLTTAGEWVSASSRALKENIRPLLPDTALAALRSLEPVEFNYRAEPKDGQVGFIAEDVPTLVATPDRKGLASMDITAVLTRVVRDQQELIEELRMRIDRLEGDD